MLVGTVIENIWATRKENGLKGLTFLVVQPGFDEKQASTQMPIIVIDRIGAGIGDRVIVAQGSPATYFQNTERIPIDALVIGIVDSPSNGS